MLVLAHRGCRSTVACENTMVSFEEAIRLGAQGIEFDVRASRDGRLVLVHDANLRRIAGRKDQVASLLASELVHLPLRRGGHLLTLNDVTANIPAPIILDIDIKSADAVDPLIEKLQTSRALRERTIVSSFRPAFLHRVSQALPDVRTLYLFRRFPLRPKAFTAKLLSAHPWGAAFPLTGLTLRRVRLLRRLGIDHIGAWDLLSTTREARRIAKLGVDVAIVHRVNEILMK